MCVRLGVRCWSLLVLLVAFASPADSGARRNPIAGQALKIRHYTLKLSFDPAAKTVSGTVDIRFRAALFPGRALTVDMAPTLTALRVSLDGAPAPFTHSGTRLRVAIPAPLAAARLHHLTIAYAGSPGRFLRFDSVAGEPAIASYGMPYSALTWWPSFDEPAYKATAGADIILSAPKGDVAVSNGVLIGTRRLADGGTRYHWRETYPIYPDVISVAIGPYREIRGSFRSITGRAIPLTFYLFPADVSRAAHLLRIVPRILGLYESLFGPYPFQREKYGLAEMTIPSFREHQTIPSIGRGLLLGTTPVWDLRDLDNVIAHDMAHQWFGDSVTPRRWSDVWLNEGFANYAVALWHEKEGGEPALRRFMRSLDTGPFAGSVYIAAGRPREDLLTYTTFNKAAWVLHMLRHVMGDAAFFAALEAYAQENRGGLVDTRTWIAVCERKYGHPLGWFFREWLYGTGRPELRLAWRERGGREARVAVTIRQRQPGRPFQMPVDLELVTGSGSEVRTVWVRRRLQRFTLATRSPVSKVILDPDDWLLRKLR